MTTQTILFEWLQSPEGTNLEFKEAKHNYPFDKLLEYCVAIANEGGGKIILGVTDSRPRTIVGTAAFAEPGRTESGLYDRLHHRIPVEEIVTPQGRVLVVHVPPRQKEVAWQIDGRYLKRAGDELTAMTSDELRNILNETGADFSAEICVAASIEDLDNVTIEYLRTLWQRKTQNPDIATRSVKQLLTDAELLVDGKVTYAALILLGTRQALGKYLAQSEIVFEYRSSEEPGPAAERREFRLGSLPILDEVWNLVNKRNDLQHFHQGLFIWDIPTFNENVIREALLNAVSHRDYKNGGSIFVRQYSRRIEIVSPGGLPSGITTENIIQSQNPRNRRIAEVLSKCGLVERAGQGFDLIVRECIRESKLAPDFTHTDSHQVFLTLHCEIQDPEFLRFLEIVTKEQGISFGTEDFLALDQIHREGRVSDLYKSRLKRLLEHGLVERVSRKLLLSRKFYKHLGKTGTYTREKGLDVETNKELLMKHIVDSGSNGSTLSEFKQVLRDKSRDSIQKLVQKLKHEGRIEMRGVRGAGARWYLASTKESNAR